MLNDKRLCLREEQLPFPFGLQSPPSNQCDPHRKGAAGYNAVTLSTSLQGGSPGEAERQKDESRLKWFLLSPPESFLSPCPRLENQVYWSVQLLMLQGFCFPLTFSSSFSPNSPNFVILNYPVVCIYCQVWSIQYTQVTKHQQVIFILVVF